MNLIDKDNNDYKLCPKLSTYHIDCKHSDRQRVKYAVQLMSNSVSKAILHIFGTKYSKEADIISTIDSYFDVMNSRNKYH